MEVAVGKLTFPIGGRGLGWMERGLPLLLPNRNGGWWSSRGGQGAGSLSGDLHLDVTLVILAPDAHVFKGQAIQTGGGKARGLGGLFPTHMGPVWILGVSQGMGWRECIRARSRSQ